MTPDRICHRTATSMENLTSVLLAGEDVDSDEGALGVAVLSGLRRGHIGDLAGESLHHDVAALAEGTGLGREGLGGTAGSKAPAADALFCGCCRMTRISGSFFSPGDLPQARYLCGGHGHNR